MPLVRDASLEDVGRVAEIHVESWRHAYRDLLPSEYLDALSIDSRRNWLERRLTSLEPRGAILVVENSHSVSGFAFLGPFSETEGEIYAIYVAPESWRQGLGRVLLRGAEARLESEGFDRGILWVLEGNQRARKFYEALDWKADGVFKIEEIGETQVTELRYSKHLGSSGREPSTRSVPGRGGPGT